MVAAHKCPRHVAVVMDGNGRWAEQHHLPRLEGHRRGANTARHIVEWAADAGVRQISLFAFSTENWARPKAEVDGLMSLLATRLVQELPDMQAKGVCFRTMGDISALPGRARKTVERACAETRENTRIDLILCLNYGGQQEIIAGARALSRWAMCQSDPDAALAAVDVQGFRRFLWCADTLPVDLLIRTGGERRISNFLLWDAAYAELYFCDKYWPDFTREDFHAALEDFSRRERRFGRVGTRERR